MEDVLLWEPGPDRVRCLTGVISTVTTPSPSVPQTSAPVRSHHRPGAGAGAGGVWVLGSGPTVLLSPPGVNTPVLSHQTLPVLRISVIALLLPLTHCSQPSKETCNDLIENTQNLINYQVNFLLVITTHIGFGAFQIKVLKYISLQFFVNEPIKGSKEEEYNYASTGYKGCE